MIRILLIDDDPSEEMMVTRILDVLCKNKYELVYVDRLSAALSTLNARAFDFILLDDRLTRTMASDFAVPMLKQTAYLAPIVVISNDTTAGHLQDNKRLGVSAIVDKLHLAKFLKALIPNWELGIDTDILKQ